MCGPMPYTVSFIHGNMVHLNREPDIKCLVPGIVEDIIPYLEDAALMTSVFNDIPGSLTDEKSNLA